jgi:hypothetical protein
MEADSPPSHSLGPLAALARLAAERPTVRRLTPSKLLWLHFELLTEIRDVETIATGRGVRVRFRLTRQFGRGNWRKRKGFARIRLPNGREAEAELHWYEAHGIGKRGMKIKRYVRL